MENMKYILRRTNNKNIVFDDSNINTFKKLKKIIIKKYLILDKNNLQEKYNINNINPNNYLIFINGKLINFLIDEYKNDYVKYKNISNESFTNSNFINVEVVRKLKGGFIIDLLRALIAIVKFLIIIPKIIIWFASLIIWSIKTMFYFISLTFKVLSRDGITGLIYFLTVEICLAPIRVIFIIFKNIINYIGKHIFGIAFGVDNRPPDNPDEHSDHFKGKCSNRKCYAAPDGTIPFTVIISTILCPPVGVFMEFGLSGWFQIMICGLLTLMFYFPGLIYALILLYC
tara:strand:+ start:93 stop:950 length:858 start_codon:yes stop_codon:yes gene_type:complete